MKQDDGEKKKKAGNPIFILIIFIILIVFVFFVPNIYKTFNSNIAEFLGVGSDKDINENTPNPDDEKSAMSEYYQIGSRSTLSFNEITLSNISLTSGILDLTVSTDEKVDLTELDYYIEFYENRSVFVGRRVLSGEVNKTKNLSIDVSNLNVTTTTYIVISRIEESSVGPIDMPTDESGVGSLNCIKKDYTYTYDFELGKLIRVVKKYSYTNFDLSKYSDELIKNQKIANEYNELNGVTASIVDNSNTFMFTSEFDYSKIKSFASINDKYIFSKDEKNNVISFKMEAEGFDCE